MLINNKVANMCTNQSMSVTQNTKVMTSALANKVNMNNTKLNIYKRSTSKSLLGLKSLIEIKLKRFVSIKNYYLWKRQLFLFIKNCDNF